MLRGWRRGLAASVTFVCVAGCYGIRVSSHTPSTPEYKPISRPAVAADDLGLPGLRRAALASRRYYSRPAAGSSYHLGEDTYTSAQIARSIEYFLQIVEETPPRALNNRLARECRGYTPTRGGARFTAYYEPVLEARTQPDARFRYPIYRKPEGGLEPLRSLSRDQIDRRQMLAGRGLELAWVDDPVGLYFLHVQGSGRLRLPGGHLMRVNFASSNGRPYVSVGRYLLDNGYISAGSVEAIRAYLDANPETRDEILSTNGRYIFFRQVDLADNEGPIGSLGVPLIAGRSIAADQRFVPPGAVVYIKTRAPVVDTRGKLVGWNRLARFAFNHDSGAAIKGPGRADIYWGEGTRAGMAAGFVNNPGDMIVLVCGVEPRTVASRGSNGLARVSWPEVERVLAAVSDLGR